MESCGNCLGEEKPWYRVIILILLGLWSVSYEFLLFLLAMFCSFAGQNIDFLVLQMHTKLSDVACTATGTANLPVHRVHFHSGGIWHKYNHTDWEKLTWYDSYAKIDGCMRNSVSGAESTMRAVYWLIVVVAVLAILQLLVRLIYMFLNVATEEYKNSIILLRSVFVMSMMSAVLAAISVLMILSEAPVTSFTYVAAERGLGVLTWPILATLLHMTLFSSAFQRLKTADQSWDNPGVNCGDRRIECCPKAASLKLYNKELNGDSDKNAYDKRKLIPEEDGLPDSDTDFKL